MQKKRINIDILWGYLSQFLQYGSALLLLPSLLYNLSSSELGLWYIFISVSNLINLLDTGLSASISRNISYILSGARSIQKIGYVAVGEDKSVDFGLLVSLIHCSKKIYLISALVSFLFLSTLGSCYIWFISRDSLQPVHVLLSWGVFVSASFFNLYFKFYTPILQGRGQYNLCYKANSVSIIFMVFISVILLKLQFGLLGVSIASLISALVGRYLSHYYLYDDDFRQIMLSKRSLPLIAVAGSLWPNSWRVGIGAIGSFLILRGNIIIASLYFGLAITASYALTLQVFSTLMNISCVVFNISQPLISKYRIQGNIKKLRSVINSAYKYAFITYIPLSLFVVIFGNKILFYLRVETVFLPNSMTAMIFIMLLFEMIHSIAAGIILTGNEVPFVFPAIVSGVLIILISLIGVTYISSGVYFLIISQFIIQLLYNNWRWPLTVYLEIYKN